MEKEIIVKIARFVKLSKKFTKDRSKVLDFDPVLFTFTLLGTNEGITVNSTYYEKDIKVKSELEQYKEKCEEQIRLFEEYTEYLKLGKELEEYTKATLNIIN